MMIIIILQNIENNSNISLDISRAIMIGILDIVAVGQRKVFLRLKCPFSPLWGHIYLRPSGSKPTTMFLV